MAVKFSDDFTGDVTALVLAGPKEWRLHIFRSVPKKKCPRFIRDGIVQAIAPEVRKTSSFIQQIVARALVEHVDWEAVALAATTDEQSN